MTPHALQRVDLQKHKVFDNFVQAEVQKHKVFDHFLGLMLKNTRFLMTFGLCGLPAGSQGPGSNETATPNYTQTPDPPP